MASAADVISNAILSLRTRIDQNDKIFNECEEKFEKNNDRNKSETNNNNLDSDDSPADETKSSDGELSIDISTSTTLIDLVNRLASQNKASEVESAKGSKSPTKTLESKIIVKNGRRLVIKKKLTVKNLQTGKKVFLLNVEEPGKRDLGYQCSICDFFTLEKDKGMKHMSNKHLNPPKPKSMPNPNGSQQNNYAAPSSFNAPARAYVSPSQRPLIQPSYTMPPPPDRFLQPSYCRPQPDHTRAQQHFASRPSFPPPQNMNGMPAYPPPNFNGPPGPGMGGPPNEGMNGPPSGGMPGHPSGGMSGTRHKCKWCNDSFENVSSVKKHSLNHFRPQVEAQLFSQTANAPPYTCPGCNMQQRDKTTLLRHYAFSHRVILNYCSEEDLRGMPVDVAAAMKAAGYEESNQQSQGMPGQPSYESPEPSQFTPVNVEEFRNDLERIDQEMRNENVSVNQIGYADGMPPPSTQFPHEQEQPGRPLSSSPNQQQPAPAPAPYINPNDPIQVQSEDMQRPDPPMPYRPLVPGTARRPSQETPAGFPIDGAPNDMHERFSILNSPNTMDEKQLELEKKLRMEIEKHQALTSTERYKGGKDYVFLNNISKADD